MSPDSSSNVLALEIGPQDPVEYDKWFRGKVQQSIEDPRPSIPHDQVMSEMRTLIAKKSVPHVE